MTTLLVVGSAPGLFEDLEQARSLFWDSEVMTVNGACAAVEHAEHILAGHTARAEEYNLARKKAFPNAVPWRVHAAWRSKRPIPKKEFPSVTDWWGAEMSSGATSAGKAAMIGIAMKFDTIVLCGCPLDGSGYFPGECEGIWKDPACQRIGDARMQNRKIIQRYKDRMRELAANEFKGRVFSMSGYTRELLGAPQEGIR
jgi:hypothetical protein